VRKHTEVSKSGESVEKIGAFLNWRWAVLGLEVAVAAGCFFSGWRLVSDHHIPPLQVHHSAPAAAQDVGGPISIPMASPGAGSPRAGVLGLSPTTDLLSRLSRDDVGFYKTEWGVIQVLVDGTRQFIEQRVVPSLMAAK
jgi:hypothetical protein